MEAQIVMPDYGKHSNNIDETVKRLKKSGSYKDMSCIVVIPAFGQVPTKVIASWWNMFFPPNQQVHKVFAIGMEVGEAFSQTIQQILDNPTLSKIKYLITMEHDNVAPPDGVVRLLADLEEHPEYACVGGLYFTKGDGGVAQIWGDPKDPVLNYRPQLPDPNGGLVECNGTGMGFNAWRLDMFKDERLRKPWFKTTSSTTEGTSTQDLYFWGDAKKYGYRCAIDCSVRVGHYDYEGKFGIPDFTW
jgi:hypothetical protein